MKIVYLGLGSNLGDRRSNLESAVQRLGSPELRVLRQSSIYETEPRDLVDQSWFLNQVIEVETTLFPRQLLRRLQKFELDMGRRRSVPKGPRLIDLDILLYASAKISAPGLEIPHPRMAERRFVLEPLAELAPDLRHPLTGQTIKEMLARVSGQAVRRIT
ncbi:MAG: 2-amino-4-hydroxy-6-hydroxymethyldihydropteridine diphosphokinase [Bryobacteraceae bacterium]